MRYLPLTAEDREDMLAAIGVADVDALFADIPADKLTRALVPLSRALMNMPVGELQAALAGREPTGADRSRRLADELGPEGQKELEASVAAAGPKMQAMQKALVAALPALMSALGDVEKQLERATANLPDPTYPKR